MLLFSTGTLFGALLALLVAPRIAGVSSKDITTMHWLNDVAGDYVVLRVHSEQPDKLGELLLQNLAASISVLEEASTVFHKPELLENEDYLKAKEYFSSTINKSANQEGQRTP